jgi:hypothetical protein
MSLADDLGRAMPFAGPCAMCGHHDKRHRMLSMWRERHRAGEPIAEIVADYRYPESLVRAVIGLSGQAYGALLRRKSDQREAP